MSFSPNSTPPGTRGLLRRLTADVHLQVETSWSSAAGFASEIEYTRFLGQAIDVHCRLGMAAAQIWGNPDDIATEQRRIACLNADLCMTLDPVALPTPMSPGYAWGIAYVLNGSSLGGSVMLKRGCVPSHWPSQYFENGRDFVQSGRLKDFFDRLDAATACTEDALRGAKDCFAAFLGGENHASRASRT